MIVKLTEGRSFRGAAAYFLHDRNASTRERVAWTHTENLLTRDPDKAWKVMAYTCMVQEQLKQASGQARTGRKLEKPVFTYSLSWHEEDRPDREHMLATAQRSLQALGLTGHEVLIVGHRDTKHPHCHVIVNRVHPVTGRAADVRFSKRKFSEFARTYEHERGVIRCHQREENHMQREQGKPTRHRDPNIVAAWRESDDGRSFAAALKERGYHLAQGRKRIVVVDPYGRSINPIRHLEGVRTRELDDRLGDLDRSRLPDATLLGKSIEARRKHAREASEEHDRQTSERLNRLQDRQLAERAKAFNHHQDRIEKERGKLMEHYRLAEQREAIDELTTKVARPAWWRRLFGLAGRDKAQLETLQLNHASARSRLDERIQFLEAERDRTLTALQERHQQERERVQERVLVRRPANYLERREREAVHEQDNAPRPARQRTPRGPSFG